MSERPVCPSCGAELPSGAPEGVCPKCLLGDALGGDGETTPTPEGDETTLDTPPPDATTHAGQIGPYKILEPLGEGGMGIVYLAEQQQPIRRRVALKVIKLGMDTREVVARFESERQALALMDHPHIAKVFDAGASDDGRPYFVMEYVPGERITDYCDRHRLSNQARLQLFGDVCGAIQHAHQKGLIHRDIKPSNVLVMVQDGRPVPKVIDFGVAKATNQRLSEKTVFTRQGMLIGTPEYMSPEQAEMSGLDVDTTTDIYSLGVLLYELLVGALPFDSAALRQAGYAEIQRIIREEEPVRPSTRLSSLGATASEVAARRRTDLRSLQRQLRGDLDWITLKAMDKDRTRRYASASELAADIQRHLGDDPVVARPPSAAYRLQKLLKKNKGPVAAALVVLIVLLAGLGTSTLLFLREQTARAAEGEQRALAQRQGYMANIVAAHLHLQNNDAGEARRRLAMCEPSLRGWEWRYLSRQADGSVAALQATDEVASVWFGPSGTTVFGQPSDTVQTWDATTHQTLVTKTLTSVGLLEADDRPMILDTSPDGTHVLLQGVSLSDRFSRGPDGYPMFVVELGTDQRLVSTLVGHGVPALAGAFSPDGSTVVTTPIPIGVDAPAVWNATTGQRVVVLDEAPPTGEFTYGLHRRSVLFNPDGRRIALGTSRGSVLVSDADTGRMLTTMEGHDSAVIALAFSPDGSRIVSGSDDSTARIWDVDSGQLVAELRGHEARVTSVAFSPDGTEIVTGAEDTTLRVWDAEGGTALATLLGHERDVTALAFSPDGSSVWPGSGDATLRRWEMTSRSGLTWVDGERWDDIQGISPDGRWVVSQRAIGSLTVRDAASSEGEQILRWPDTSLGQVVFSPDSSRVSVVQSGFSFRVGAQPEPMSRPQSNGIRVWDLASGRELSTFEEHEDAIRAVVFSPDGTRIASGSADRTLRIWDVVTGEIVGLVRAEDDVLAVAFSPDGTRIAAGLANGLVRLWDTDGFSEVLALRGHEAAVRSLAFSPDGTRVVSSVAPGGIVHVWDAVTGAVTARINAADVPSAVAVSPDGTRLAVAGRGVSIWDTSTFERLLTLTSQVEGISLVSFSPDGTRLRGTGDSGIQQWDAGEASAPGGPLPDGL